MRVHDFMERILTDDREIAKEAARDHYLGMMLIIKADRKQYGGLITSLKNQHNQNIQGYPVNSQQAYQMLVDYVLTSTATSHHENHGGAISYLQHDDEKMNDNASRSTVRSGCSGGRSSDHGGWGGQPSSRHSDEASHHTKAIPNNSEMSEPYFVFVAHDMHNGELFISRKGPASLPETWLLIDSCSTVDIISSAELLHGIHKVSNPIRVWCNAGVTTLDRMGYLGDYPQPVCYNPDGGANIMSMFNISQHNHLSMNTHEANGILMHHYNGNVTIFTPSSNGLYKHALSNNESINGFWSCIQTVSEHKDHYTQRKIETANQARQFQNIIM